jgi:hypothetical protein
MNAKHLTLRLTEQTNMTVTQAHRIYQSENDIELSLNAFLNHLLLEGAKKITSK